MWVWASARHSENARSANHQSHITTSAGSSIWTVRPASAIALYSTRIASAIAAV